MVVVAKWLLIQVWQYFINQEYSFSLQNEDFSTLKQVQLIRTSVRFLYINLWHLNKGWYFFSRNYVTQNNKCKYVQNNSIYGAYKLKAICDMRW